MLRIAQPCAENWDAMLPTSTGRHCAICQKTVVDFTQKTDAEILAYFRQAGSGETCGRLGLDQLNRPLRPAVVAAPAPRWRAWLALGLAVWATGRAAAAPNVISHPTQHTPHKTSPKRRPGFTRTARYVQGTVCDSATGAPLAGVVVFLRGENRQATTDANGWFGLHLSPRRPRGGRALILRSQDHLSETVRLPATSRPVTRLHLTLRSDPSAAGVVVTGLYIEHKRQYASGSFGPPSTVIEECETQSSAGHSRSFFNRLFHLFFATKP